MEPEHEIFSNVERRSTGLQFLWRSNEVVYVDIDVSASEEEYEGVAVQPAHMCGHIKYSRKRQRFENWLNKLCPLRGLLAKPAHTYLEIFESLRSW